VQWRGVWPRPPSRLYPHERLPYPLPPSPFPRNQPPLFSPELSHAEQLAKNLTDALVIHSQILSMGVSADDLKRSRLVAETASTTLHVAQKIDESRLQSPKQDSDLERVLQWALELQQKEGERSAPTVIDHEPHLDLRHPLRADGADVHQPAAAAIVEETVPPKSFDWFHGKKRVADPGTMSHGLELSTAASPQPRSNRGRPFGTTRAAMAARKATEPLPESQAPRGRPAGSVKPPDQLGAESSSVIMKHKDSAPPMSIVKIPNTISPEHSPFPHQEAKAPAPDLNEPIAGSDALRDAMSWEFTPLGRGNAETPDAT